MRKTYAKTTSAVLAAALLGTTAACASDGGSGEGDGTVTVGAILSMSGVYSTLGPPAKNAMQMGLEALNERGFEVDGRQYEMRIEFADDRSDAATSGVTALRELAQAEEVPVVAYGLGSDTYVPQLERTPLPMVNIIDSVYPSILDLSDHFFRTRGDSPTYVPGCLYYARQELDVDSISVITAAGEAYGEGLTQLVEQSAEREGVDIAASTEFPLGATDYSNAIDRAVAADPDAIYLSSVTAVILPVLKQLRQSGWDGPVLHSAGVNPEQAEAILGGGFNSIMEDNYDCAGTMPATSDNPATVAFAEDYVERYNEYPQDLTMWAYDFPFIVAEAMAQAGTTTDREAIEAALHEIGVPEGTVSGWLPGQDGQLFTERMARTESEVSTWCSEGQTLGSVMRFDVEDGQVVEPELVEDPCA
ncbi:ABC transporter substrate-binding protein [Streptomyces sp. DSM 44917]|uniref:ABC transporter substrate-binding protein n=1 Tax=Streptomyces boetiae TaxID=3075541 RepID=A0ABU2LFD2_9ACTN|nr:ABC transporter substrate-binding protein [Streptomyces sp. DSM 44917]MDT0309973.1 ABC transporter substrate-binding protein [Streptomyces sp. DSM 44917]